MGQLMLGILIIIISFIVIPVEEFDGSDNLDQ